MKKTLVNIVFLIGIMFLLAVGVSAADNGHRVVSQAELQGQVFLDDVLSTEDQEFDRFSSMGILEKVYEIEGVAAGESVDYYVPFKSGFFLLTSLTNSTLSRTMYSAGNNNNHIYQKWRFTPDQYGDYVIYSCAYPSKCLTINYSTLEVTLSEYTGSQFQKWGIYTYNGGKVLVSEAATQTNGFKLYIKEGKLCVNYSKYEHLYLFDVNSFVPTESVTLETIYIGENRTVAVSPIVTPANATIKPYGGLGGWGYNTMHGFFTVSDSGVVAGIQKGTHYIMYTDPITKVSATSMVNVYDIVVNLDVEYDYGYGCQFVEEDDRIIDALKKLQSKYAVEFGVYIDYSIPMPFESLADSCPTAKIYEDRAYAYECDCIANNSLCENMSSEDGGIGEYEELDLSKVHHKNIYNIMYSCEYPDIEQTLKMLFTGHQDLCLVEGNTHYSPPPYAGLTNKSIGVSIIFDYLSEASEQQTVVHEFGHYYYAKDHYSDDIIDVKTDPDFGEAYDDNCIYGKNLHASSVSNNLIICDGCKEQIRANLYRYDHK